MKTDTQLVPTMWGSVIATEYVGIHLVTKLQQFKYEPLIVPAVDGCTQKNRIVSVSCLSDRVYI